LHHAEKGTIERVVVSIGEEVVVSGEGGVGFELVVAVETGLGTSEDGAERGSGCGITSDGELLSYKVTVGEGKTEGSEKCGQVVSDVVEVLLGIDQLVECGDTIVREEVVAANISKRNLMQARTLDLLGCGVQSWAGTTDIVRSRSLIVVSSVTISGYLVSTDALSGYTVLGTVVRVL